MQTILDVFDLLHFAINSGFMTQEALAVAAIGISCRIHAGSQDGSISPQQLKLLSREMQHLDLHWKSYREERGRLCLPRDARAQHPPRPAERPLRQAATQSVVLTAVMKRAGAAVIKEGLGLDVEELASRIFLAMARTSSSS